MNLLAVPRKCIPACAFALLLTTSLGASAQAVPTPAAPAAGHAFEIRVVGRKPVGGARTVRVARGETVVLRVQSDEALSAHVHGYGVHVDVVPGTVASVSFKASYVGRFPVAAHLGGTNMGHHEPEPTLLYLEIPPE